MVKEKKKNKSIKTLISIFFNLLKKSIKIKPKIRTKLVNKIYLQKKTIK